MKTGTITATAALGTGLISLCCGIPLLIAILGVGSYSLSVAIADYHWFLTSGAVLVVGLGWGLFIRERRKCDTNCATPRSLKIARNGMVVASVIVASLFALNMYSLVKSNELEAAAITGKLAEFQVSGMTCASCELHVEGTINKLAGINSVKASSAKGSVFVDYEPADVSLDTISQAINSTGYRVDSFKGRSQ